MYTQYGDEVPTPLKQFEVPGADLVNSPSYVNPYKAYETSATPIVTRVLGIPGKPDLTSPNGVVDIGGMVEESTDL